MKLLLALLCLIVAASAFKIITIETFLFSTSCSGSTLKKDYELDKCLTLGSGNTSTYELYTNCSEGTYYHISCPHMNSMCNMTRSGNATWDCNTVKYDNKKCNPALFASFKGTCGAAGTLTPLFALIFVFIVIFFS